VHLTDEGERPYFDILHNPVGREPASPVVLAHVCEHTLRSAPPPLPKRNRSKF
jgi:hypothetical protein